MKLYNSRTRQKEVFTPLKPDEVSLYLCGPTVYDSAHIGNARPSVVFDTLYRLLSRDYKVTYVRNITDVDDKIIEAARKNQESIESLTKRTTVAYHEDMEALNILPPTIEPRATTHIAEMIEMIQTLIQKGHAYEAEGHVLFDTRSDSEYGSLSHRDLDDMIAGARVEVAPYKKNAMDFVLWKPSSEDTPGWESPWGRGRPGWHIECSAMSHKHLGITFDIHGGGIDLIFPHHENERAQSTCAFGKETFARLWMHNGLLVVDGKKMSKSLGNFFTVRDLLKTLPGEVIRLTLLSAHYRQPLDWISTLVQQSKSTLDRFYQALRDVPLDQNASVHPDVLAALEDDLNTPLALAVMASLVKEIHGTQDAKTKSYLASSLKVSGQFLGILLSEAEAWFKRGSSSLTEEEIQTLINQRTLARQTKDFAEADRVRRLLEENGVILEDSPSGTTWKHSEP